jgi:hypothetical protein
VAGDAIDFSQAASFLNLGAVITSDTETSARLTLGAAVKQVEFDIEPVAPLAYETSDWLTFVNSPNGNPPPGWSVALGAPGVPILARSFPSSPLSIAQKAEADSTAPAGWQGAPFWRYIVSFSYAAAPQDQIVFGAVFNHSPSQSPSSPEPGLFEALANYQAQRASIWEDIEGKDIVSGANDFATQVQHVLTAWQGHWQTKERDARMARLYRIGQPGSGAIPVAFTGTLAHFDGVYTELVVEPAEGTPLVTAWPDIAVMADGKTWALIRTSGVPGRMHYAFPSGASVRLGAELTYEISIGGLHVAQYQEAYGGVAVIRNAVLLGLDGPAILGDFIYRAPPAVFPVSVAPYLSFAGPFDAGPWTPNGQAELATILAATLTSGGATLVTLAIEARSGSAAISPSLPLRLPVFYAPQVAYPGTVALDIQQKIASWASTWEPPSGWWEIIVTAYSALPDRLNEPLIALRLAFDT